MDLDPEMKAALAAARDRGRISAAEILDGDDMLSIGAFAEKLGQTQEMVAAMRQSGKVLGLNGDGRDVRFPAWQLSVEGFPYPELSLLHQCLGGHWAVYRFLVQHHGALNGLTGRQALERGKGKNALDAAESVARDFD
ncbi:hypothetical protein [Caulobacter radicis]|uniref:hypothetical protein n=1 Tax=Caulobacter radicis TaxID=2172650 RepID=UPI001057A1FB|nr:hypothetical protein [Caulobacter radicis]